MLRYVCVAFVLAACGGGGGGDETNLGGADLEGVMGSPVRGDAMFTQLAAGTTLEVALENCVVGKAYPLFILDGSSCASTSTQGNHWDATRGEGIPPVVCNDTGLYSSYTREPTDAATRWTVGDHSATDVHRHVLVVQDPDDNTTRIACGAIYLIIPR